MWEISTGDSMCGRYSIYEPMDHYLKKLAPEQLVINGCYLWPIERYNVAPTSRVEIVQPADDFTWRTLSMAVGDMRNHGSELIDPLTQNNDAW